MAHPVAFQLRAPDGRQIHAVTLDPAAAAALKRSSHEAAPTILRVGSVEMLGKLQAGVFDAADAEVLVDGDWDNALLIVAPSAAARQPPADANGDKAFLEYVNIAAPEIHALAAKLLDAIRSAGIEGHLVREGFRWVNRPLNSFTIAVQTRVKNFQFTLYGGTERFGRSDFIKSDQNGYSRGWVRCDEDVPRFLELAKIAHARKRR
jgi:hypothetical protein